MLGWFSPAAAFASRWKRFSKLMFSLKWRGNTFSATIRSRDVSRALRTTPIPPRPTSPRILYFGCASAMDTLPLFPDTALCSEPPCHSEADPRKTPELIALRCLPTSILATHRRGNHRIILRKSPSYVATSVSLHLDRDNNDNISSSRCQRGDTRRLASQSIYSKWIRCLTKKSYSKCVAESDTSTLSRKQWQMMEAEAACRDPTHDFRKHGWRRSVEKALCRNARSVLLQNMSLMHKERICEGCTWTS